MKTQDIPFLDLYAAFDPPPPPRPPALDLAGDPDDDDYIEPPLGPIAFDEFAGEIMELYSNPSVRAEGTRRMMMDSFARLKALEVTSTKHLTLGLVARFVERYGPGWSPNTVRKELRLIRVICNFAVKLGYLRISPFDVRPMNYWVRPAPSSPEARGEKCHPRADIARVLAEMRRRMEVSSGWERWRNHRLLALTSTLAYTGLRAGEAYHLQVRDLDLDAAFLRVVARAEHKLKTLSSAATVPLADPLVSILREWLEHRLDHPPGFRIDPESPWCFPTADRRHPWTSGYPGSKPRDRMVAVAAELGISGFNPLSLRHSLATHLVAAGMGQSQLKRVLRHTNEKTQEWYIHDDLEGLREGIARIEY